MAAVSAPETAETKAETRGDEIRTADLVATALTRYAQAFATFGLMALVAAAFPALVVVGLRGADADAEVIVTVGSFAAAAAALALAGAMTAFIGQRLRRTLPGIVATALLVAPPFGVVAILHLAAIFVVPLLLAPLGLAPVAAGAGDGAGLTACRRALVAVRAAAAIAARWCPARSPHRSRRRSSSLSASRSRRSAGAPA